MDSFKYRGEMAYFGKALCSQVKKGRKNCSLWSGDRIWELGAVRAQVQHRRPHQYGARPVMLGRIKVVSTSTDRPNRGRSSQHGIEAGSPRTLLLCFDPCDTLSRTVLHPRDKLAVLVSDRVRQLPQR